MYWVMSDIRTHETQALIHGVPEVIENNHYRFNQGNVFIDNLGGKITLELDEEVGSFSDCVHAPGLQGLVINQKIKDIFNALEIENIQYFPADIITVDKQVYSYFIANIVGLYDIVDYEETTVRRRKSSGNIASFRNLTFIDTDELILPEVFRWSQLKSIIIASDKVKDAIESENCSGLNFVKSKSYVY